MSLKIFISNRAEEDLTNQYRWYIENASVTIAERFLTAFDKTVLRLTHSPQLGRVRQFRFRELARVRSIGLAKPFDLHLVFYKVTPTRLSIERIMHGSRDLPRRLAENP
jgi:plasmid stabilization system protein ParE